MSYLKFKKHALMLIVLCSLSSCYRMPTDNDYSLVPNVNNPDVTRGKPGSLTAPGMAF